MSQPVVKIRPPDSAINPIIRRLWDVIVNSSSRVVLRLMPAVCAGPGKIKVHDAAAGTNQGSYPYTQPIGLTLEKTPDSLPFSCH